MTDLPSILVPIGSGIGGIGLAGLLLRSWLATREAKLAELSRDVTELRDRTVNHLAARVERHIEADRSQEFAAKIETVIAQNNEIMLELKKLNRETGEQASTLHRNEKSLANLWEKFDNCRQAHGGKHA